MFIELPAHGAIQKRIVPFASIKAINVNQNYLIINVDIPQAPQGVTYTFNSAEEAELAYKEMMHVLNVSTVHFSAGGHRTITHPGLRRRN